jgi:AcrR family transcriptional regulator
MARSPAPGTRDRILDTATRLFQEQGVRAVGLQQIIDECGCGKSLLYREFASKDALVVAYLEQAQAEWSEIIGAALRPHAGDPAAQLVALVQSVADQVAAPDYAGCPFRTTHAHFPDPDHPAHQVAVRHVRDLRSRLRRLARRAGARDPNALGDRLLLIIDGLYVNGSMLGDRAAGATAVALAEELVREATAPSAPVRSRRR